MLHAARNTKTHSTHATKTCADGERTLRTRTHRYARYTNKNPQHVLGARTAPITTENEKSKSCYAMCVYAYHMYSQIEYRRKRRRKRGRRKRLKFSNVLHTTSICRRSSLDLPRTLTCPTSAGILSRATTMQCCAQCELLPIWLFATPPCTAGSRPLQC